MTPQIVTKPVPDCEDCGGQMILRRPKEGDDWEPFWGCSNYPECKFTMNIDPDGYPISKYDDSDSWDGHDDWGCRDG